MKKALSIIFALLIALSVCTVAFATGEYTCPTCKATYYDVDEYNQHLSSHIVRTCPTCGKKYDNIDDYNACIDSHRMEDPTVDKFEYGWDKYFSSKTIYEVFDILMGYFNDLGIANLFKDVLNRIVDFVESYVYAKVGI